MLCVVVVFVVILVDGVVVSDGVIWGDDDFVCGNFDFVLLVEYVWLVVVSLEGEVWCWFIGIVVGEVVGDCVFVICDFLYCIVELFVDCGVEFFEVILGYGCFEGVWNYVEGNENFLVVRGIDECLMLGVDGFFEMIGFGCWWYDVFVMIGDDFFGLIYLGVYWMVGWFEVKDE